MDARDQHAKHAQQAKVTKRKVLRVNTAYPGFSATLKPYGSPGVKVFFSRPGGGETRFLSNFRDPEIDSESPISFADNLLCGDEKRSVPYGMYQSRDLRGAFISRFPRKPVARHHQLARVLVLARRVARLSADHKLGLGEGLREIEGRLEGADNIIPPVVRVRVRGVGSGSGV